MGEVARLLRISRKIYHEGGFFSLLSRIRLYFRDVLSSALLPGGDILYISGCPGGSKFYRCSNQCEEMAIAGFRADIVTQRVIRFFHLYDRYEIFIFQRPIYDETLDKFVSLLNKKSKHILCEFDDLVFNPEYLSFLHYYSHMGPEEKSWYENGIGRQLLESDFVTDCIVSTDYLKKKLLEKYPDKNVFVSYNKLNVAQIRNAERAIQKGKKEDGKIRIGYFSGSPSHNNDFNVVNDVLKKILRENANVILFIVGHLKLDADWQSYSQQIETVKFVPIKKLPEIILKVDINIVPLEINNPFCQGKSALKYFEAGILGIPTIASATDSFERVIVNGENGYLTRGESDWYTYLNRLILDVELRKKIGENAKGDVYRKHVIGKGENSNKYLIRQLITEKD